MNVMNSKTNENLEFLYTRLDEVHMSDYDRIKAKAHMARTEAIADAAFALGRRLRSLLKALVIRPIRRMTASFG